MGVVFMFIGFTGKAFDRDSTVNLAPGQTATIGAYSLKMTDFISGQTPDYRWGQALRSKVSKNGKVLGTVEPERRYYTVSQQPTSEVSIRRRLNEDLYLNFAGTSDDGSSTVVQAYVFPLVSWIWIGYWGGADRHDHLPRSEQTKIDLSANRSRGDCGETCSS